MGQLTWNLSVDIAKTQVMKKKRCVCLARKSPWDKYQAKKHSNWSLPLIKWQPPLKLSLVPDGGVYSSNETRIDITDIGRDCVETTLITLQTNYAVM